MDAHGASDVLELLLSGIDEPGCDPIAYLAIDILGDVDATRLGDALQARRHVDAVAQQIVALDHNVPDMDADPERYPLVLGLIGVFSSHLLLHFNSTAHSIHYTRELDQDAVAGGLHDPATVGGNSRVDQLAPQRAQPRNRALLVLADQAAVPRHVGGKDRRKSALNRLSLHGWLPQSAASPSV